MKIWKPNKKQEDFLRVPYSVKEAFYGGAVFGGKSEILLMLPLLLKVTNQNDRLWEDRDNLISHPNFNCIMFRRTFPELEESLIFRSNNDGFYDEAGGTYNKQDHTWTFPSGAKVRFSYCEEDKHARAHDTSEFQLMCFDELTHFTEYQYKYLTHRVRTGRLGLPAIIRSASNPGNIGHAWVRERFIDPAPQGKVLIKDKFTKTNRIFIPAKLEDNKAGLAADPSYVNSLNILPEAERKAKIEGDWYVFSGQVFTEFRADKIPGEPENALHVIEPFKIPDWWPKLLFIDWGYIHPTYACWAALSPDKRIFFYREYRCEKTNVTTWGSDIGRISQSDNNLIHIGMDPSAWQNRGLDKTVAQQFMDSSQLICSPANNDRLGGKMLYHDYLRWRQKPPRYVPKEGYDPELADRLYRMSGEKARKEYQEMFLPQKEETNLPIIQLFNTLPELIKCLKLCIYDEKKKDNPGIKAEDVAKFVGDDAYDCSRYLLMEADRYFNGLDEEYKKVQEREKLLELRAQSMTDYYREMVALENKYKTETIAVRRRFH